MFILFLLDNEDISGLVQAWGRLLKTAPTKFSILYKVGRKVGSLY